MTPEQLVAVRPSPRQLAWQQLEFYGFVHFGMNTMTDREWGDGTEDPAWFNPERLDCDAWAAALQAAGMRGAILTCKHHDGFCLWPSAQTAHTVASSPWRGGHGDVVAEFAAACRRHGLKFGVYLSPWDRHEASYGSGAAYDDFYCAQLTELLTNYGPVFEVWFDGANGEGPNGRRQAYDWARYYALIRRLQPRAVIAVCGPDVRWIGNEAGAARLAEWSVVPAGLQDAEKTAAASQQQEDAGFSRRFNSSLPDLGSRAVLADYDGPLAWYPAEVDTSIRPGWFHHPAENAQVRTAAELFRLYAAAVGGNASFLLNVPPQADGQLCPTDVANLAALGKRLAAMTQSDVAGSATVRVSSATGPWRGITGAADSAAPTAAAAAAELAAAAQPTVPRAWQAAAEDDRPTVTLTWPKPVAFDTVALQEDLTQGQRIEAFAVEVQTPDGWQAWGEGETVGAKRLVLGHSCTTQAVRVTITRARAAATLAHIAIMTRGADE
ncbi:alpha-L-fucosidase [Lacticaseibacillus kribbianus]|uniref:alpha-L-fucosidase n=1 Tax=Lacticaseibacillus kribbianus TaxID=2926292 RepID=UPI001CD384E0|nr:alpha-L-fucosidase [Lacticaseibacillus kribbianus]